MRIVITGGAGFIGSNFVHYLVEKYGKSLSILVVDSLTYAANIENIEELIRNNSIEFSHTSINEVEKINKLLKGAHTVFNFAAESHVDNSINYPTLFMETNVMGTVTLLEASRNNGISRFIQISTDEVYGTTINEEWDEDCLLKPSSPYSASKASADNIVLSYGRTFDLDVRVTRSCNNYGPMQHDEKLIPKIINSVLMRKPIPIYGDGRNFREWIYVQDNCEAIDIIANAGKSGEIYNIGSKHRISNIALVKMFEEIMAKHQIQIQFVADRAGHDFGYALNSEKVRKLGFNSKTTLEEGLRKTVAWYLERRRINHVLIQ